MKWMRYAVSGVSASGSNPEYRSECGRFRIVKMSGRWSLRDTARRGWSMAFPLLARAKAEAERIAADSLVQ